MDNINWYPGHMKKTREMIHENLKLVDAVLELVDARIPVSGRNPLLDDLARGKRRFVLLNKSDLADEAENARWVEYLRATKVDARLLNGVSGAGVGALLRALSVARDERNAGAPRNRPFRLMVVGVPNVGKSSLINRLVGRKSAVTGDRPGVTKGKQWLSLESGIQLLDTPGILRPKFEDRAVGLKLAFCGSVRDEILDAEELALELLRTLFAMPEYAGLLAARYRLDDADKGGTGADGDGESPRDDARAVLEAIAIRRGFLLPGRRADLARAAKTLLDEFRAGRMGRITLERAPNRADGAEELP
ncbi:MAG: ribosome biogenesis GTPase YlqF [Clostridiales Family XIII bacterium]|jgi:ribosome biogenesis GTPase A|nr:ribosome biogenesis GTPase YlqF [Clostridiales Family XIII bacterium]